MRKAARVTSADGLSLATYEGGNPDGPPILFLHGFNQSALCWHRQFADRELSARFRLSAYDLRGHGASDQPADPACYASDADFAADTAAVISGLGLHRPVLVGWSYAGRVINDYLRAHGSADLAGINYVCARTNNDPAFNGPGNAHLRAMIRDDLAAEIAATRAFLRACTFGPASPDEMERMLAYNMRVRPTTRRAHLMRPADDGAVLSAITCPTLVTQGTMDLLVLPGLALHTAATVPAARLSLYPATGHSPFAEAPERFNRELADFAASLAHPIR
jgi:non-heme chloroperoxidase